MSDESTDNVCIVCFKNVIYFSIGVCDHPVCYECSTRMRVLYQQKECPICRQAMPLVIFAKHVAPFKEINFHDYKLDDLAKICFESPEVMKAYYDLQKIKCSKCAVEKQPYFPSFKHLQTHMKDEHNLSYCDLCLKHLKLFPNERRCYTKSELSEHNKKGDRDDKSHKGHSLCQFCNKRFFDPDILYRHLRKDHLFCHFCDADGHNKFYSSYEYLREHFLNKHYLCEEGDCCTEQFTNVFRTEIDLKAHRMTTHSKSLSKQAYKEARIVDLQFKVKPRAQSDNRNHSASHSRSHHEHGSASGSSERELVVVDYSEFPTLSGSSASAPPPVVARRPPERKFGPSNFRMAKEHFPALGAESSSKPSVASAPPERAKPSSAVTNNASSSATASSSAQNGHISSNSTRQVNGSSASNSVQQWRAPKNETVQPVQTKPKPAKKPVTEDFPSLGQTTSSGSSSKSKKSPKSGANASDLMQSGKEINKIKVKKKSESNNIGEASKVDKIKKKESSNEKKGNEGTTKSTKSCKECQSSSKVSKHSESSSASSRTNTNNINSSGSSNGVQDENRGKKGPLTNNNNNNANKTNQNSTRNNSQNNNSKKKDRILNESDFPSLTSNHSNNNSSNIKTVAKPDNKPSQKSFKNVTQSNSPKKNKSIPPGFESRVQPPPAFPPPGFTVLNSSSSFSSNQNLSYTYPPNFEERSQALDVACRSVFEKRKKSYSDFKQESELFIDGILSADSYIKANCESMGQEQFHLIFPELIALLPNIPKQQELFAAYSKIASKLASKLQKNECSLCRQVLVKSDKDAHSSAHRLSLNFPPLGK